MTYKAEEMVSITKQEYDYLKWFRCEADFGPAHGDVIYFMHRDYKAAGGVLPEGWFDEENEE